MKNLNTFQLFILMALMALCSALKSQAQGRNPAHSNELNKFKVIGYLFSRGNMDSASAELDWTKITHLNIAFINPDSTGMLYVPVGLSAVVKKAHDNRVKVLLSFAGGMAPYYIKNMLQPGQRMALIHKLVDFATQYNLDGIDVDLEGDFIDENYEGFILQLAAALKPKRKLLTAAVATGTGNKISNKALAQFDLINIMSYDQTGPWNRAIAGPHSTYEAAVVDLNYWNVTRAIPARMLTLGLPFYGYGFGPDIRESYDYSEIIGLYPGLEQQDSIAVPQKGTIYYNGLSTIKKKVNLALDRKAGGVMIWQLRGDAAGESSLLSEIHSLITNRKP
jgi:chitinase